MRYSVLLFALLAGYLPVSGEIPKKEMERLKSDVDIAGVTTQTTKNDNREKIEVLEVNTCQSEDDTSGFWIHIVAEVVDAKKTAYLVDYKALGPDSYDSDYQGEDYWLLRIPYGDFSRLKVTAYAVQYGIMDGDTFVVLDERFDRVKSMDELTSRTTAQFPGKASLWHYYIYEDSSEGMTESIPASIRAIK